MFKKLDKKNIFKKTTLLVLGVVFLTLLPSFSRASSITETNIFNLTNSERAKYGLSSLSWNYKLTEAARAKAQDMIDKDYFSHISPDGRTPWNFITATGYNYIYAGENLAMNFSVAEDVMAAWMASGGHRDNILSGNFKELGVGVSTGEYQGYTTTVIVQMFGAQATQVYREGKSSSSTKSSSSQAGGLLQAFDVASITVPASEIIKKRIEDFKKACDFLVRLVKEKA